METQARAEKSGKETLSAREHGNLHGVRRSSRRAEKASGQKLGASRERPGREGLRGGTRGTEGAWDNARGEQGRVRPAGA